MSDFEVIGRRDLRPRRVTEYKDSRGKVRYSYLWPWEYPVDLLYASQVAARGIWRPP